MSDTTSKSKKGFLEGLSSLIRRSTSQDSTEAIQERSKAGFKGSAKELHSAVEALKSKITKQREEQEKRMNAASSSGLEPVKSRGSGPSSKELQKKELEQAVTSMFSSMLQLHTKLGSGMSEQSLTNIETELQELLGTLKGTDLDSRIRAAIADRLTKETGPIAWQVLMHLMERTGTKWPEPTGLISGATAEQVANVTERHMQEAEDLFLSYNFEQNLACMGGVISAWKRYPDPTTWLWQEVAFRGVAAGIRCQLLQIAVGTIRANGEKIRAIAKELLDENMAKIQAVLQAGISSLEDAEEIVQSTDLVVKTALPDLAWEQVKAVVDQEVSKLVKAK